MELEEAVRNINKKTDDTITQGKDYSKVVKIPFPSPKITWQLYGGIPANKITMIYGPESSGKTTAALGFISMAQDLFPEEKTLFVDAEYALDLNWAAKMGVNTTDLLIMEPKEQSGEEVLDHILTLGETGELSTIMLDSIPALTPQDQLEGSIADKTYGGISLGLTKFLREFNKFDTSLFIINQVREEIDNPYKNLRIPGGRALRHYSSLILESKKGHLFNKDGQKVKRGSDKQAGHYVNIRIRKTKICKPDRIESSFTLNYTTGIDVISDTIDIAQKYDIINRRGAYYYIINPETGEIRTKDKEELKFHGKTALIDKLEEDDELKKNIIDQVQDITFDE